MEDCAVFGRNEGVSILQQAKENIPKAGRKVCTRLYWGEIGVEDGVCMFWSNISIIGKTELMCLFWIGGAYGQKSLTVHRYITEILHRRARAIPSERQDQTNSYSGPYDFGGPTPSTGLISIKGFVTLECIWCNVFWGPTRNSKIFKMLLWNGIVFLKKASCDW